MLKEYNPEQLADIEPDAVGDALETGHIVKFTECPIELPSAESLQQLRTDLPKQLKLKNVSYHPEADKVTGLDKDSSIADLVYDTLATHRSRVTDFLHKVMPTLSANMRVGTCSFRPLEERGRNLKPHASNELVHIDAGAYGATNGDRILRFFVNVNSDKDRVWKSKGAFPELFERYGREAGLFDKLSPSLQRGISGKLRTAMLNGMAGMGLPLATVLDSSPYDRVMRQFHNYMKDTPAFQQPAEGDQTFHFEPYTAWMVLTDMVSHASYSGQHALIYTGILPLADCRFPDSAPFNILKAAA